MLLRPVNEHLELFLRQHGAGGVVGIAQIDHVHVAVRHGGDKVVLLVAGQVHQTVPAVALVVACAAGHGIAVHVHGVHGVSHRHHGVVAEQLLNVAHVALRAVGHKHLVKCQLHAAARIVALADGIHQEVVAEVRAVAAEGLLTAHLVHSLVQCLDDSRHQRLGHVADAQTDDVGVGMRRLIFLHAPRNLRKQVGAGQLAVMIVHMKHSGTPFICMCRARCIIRPRQAIRRQIRSSLRPPDKRDCPPPTM